jgi:hypothetical protein
MHDTWAVVLAWQADCGLFSLLMRASELICIMLRKPVTIILREI